MVEKIRFAQRSEPPLRAGSYRIEVEPVSSIDCRLASEITDITVSTERFQLPPDQIYSVYPPREAIGSYSECLPHIVLNRRTLPWERTLLEEHTTMPWVALLVFDETEEVQAVEGTCGEALLTAPGIFVPDIELQSYENPDAACTYINIPADLLEEILPYREALSLLSHAKGVSLDDKVTDASVTDNWFATIVSNRYCLQPEDDAHTIRHTACLVSLEGYEALLQDKESRRAALADCTHARMIVLANWSFSMAKAAFDFNSTFSSLDAGMLSTPYKGSSELISQLCQLGYSPLNHHVRDGSQTVSWFQSPLIPYEEPKSEMKCAQFADQLLAYDPDIAMMDIRYSSAWQLGKSMALADQSFAQKLYAWRKSNERLVKASIYAGLLERHLSDQDVKTDSDRMHEDYTNVTIGQPFLRAAKEAEKNGSRSIGKQTIEQQIKQRYTTLLSEVIANADPT